MILAVVLAGSALTGLLLISEQVIEVAGRHTGKVVFREKTAPGDFFTFSYIHSIEKIPVEGRFVVEADGFLRVAETRFPSYGAGLPSGVKEKTPDGRWMVAPGGQRLSEFTFYISPINQARLRFRDTTLELTNRIESGDVVTVSVHRYPTLLRLFRYLDVKDGMNHGRENRSR